MLTPGHTECKHILFLMYMELLYTIEYVSKIPKGFGMEHALTQLAVKILLNDHTGFDEMRWKIIFPEKQNKWTMFLT